MKVKITTAVIFLSSATSLAWLFLSLPRDYRAGSVVVVVSALALVVASAGVFLMPRLSYCIGVVSGLVTLHWFSRFEFQEFPALNSWILLNLPDGDPGIFLAKLRILLVVTIVTSTACSVTRLLPASWVLRKLPLRERMWPALAVCFLVIAAWYGVSASPYRIPWIVDGAPPRLAVLHIEKRGIQFHESTFAVHNDRRFYVLRNDRRLFQYRFAVRRGSGVLPEAIATRALMLAQSTQLKELRTPPATALQNWNAEGWFIRTGRNVLAFTTEYRTEPPREMVDLFRDLESVAPAENEVWISKDVCMGFCYDPLAGLGFVYLNDRCKEQNGTHCK